MARLFADLHCHPTLYTFNRMRNDAAEDDPARFHPWHELPSNLTRAARGERASDYSQCSFARMHHAGVRVVFASITPIERGFFSPQPDAGAHHPFGAELLRWATGLTPMRGLLHWLRSSRRDAAFELSRILRNSGPLRRFIQQVFLKYSRARVAHYLSDRYDYWDEFEREYAFLRSADGVEHEASFEHVVDGQVQRAHVRGRYHLVRHPDDLARAIDASDHDIAVVLSIEGAHVLSIGPDERRVPETLLFERIQAIKQLEHPIFYITLAHHFDNGLCGHARSLPDIGHLVMDQRQRRHEDFEPEDNLGLRVTRALLDLDDDLNDLDGRRVLIDVKHMAARARKTYYDEIVRPYNAARPPNHPRQPIPVLASHAGYAAVPSLDTLIADADREHDDWRRGGYYAWNINLSDEDVREVFLSRGLIGLCFDQRICGVSNKQTVDDAQWIDVLLHQLLGMVDAVLLDDSLDPDPHARARIWDCLCIGSDFDGMIDPVSAYPTVQALPRFADALHTRLHALRHTRSIGRIGVDALVEKIAWRNAHDFLQRHLVP